MQIIFTRFKIQHSKIKLQEGKTIYVLITLIMGAVYILRKFGLLLVSLVSLVSGTSLPPGADLELVTNGQFMTSDVHHTHLDKRQSDVRDGKLCKNN